jgi:hypothetical protein
MAWISTKTLALLVRATALVEAQAATGVQHLRDDVAEARLEVEAEVVEETVVAQFKDMNPPEDAILPLSLHLLLKETKGLILQITKEMTEDDLRETKAHEMARFTVTTQRWVLVPNFVSF